MKLESQTKRGHFEAGPNLMPVVNIAMVVLIVFMIGASFAGSEHFLESNNPITPTGAGGIQPPPGFIPDEPLEIRVDSPTPDRFIARAGQIQTSDAASLAEQLKKMHQQFRELDIPAGKIQVRISPGRNVRYKYLIAVYQAAKEAEFEKIGFTTAH